MKNLKLIVIALVAILTVTSCAPKKVIFPSTPTGQVEFELVSTDTLPKHIVYGYNSELKDTIVNVGFKVSITVPAEKINLIFKVTSQDYGTYYIQASQTLELNNNRQPFLIRKNSSCPINHSEINDNVTVISELK